MRSPQPTIFCLHTICNYHRYIGNACAYIYLDKLNRIFTESEKRFEALANSIAAL